jgi:hypothetical protein
MDNPLPPPFAVFDEFGKACDDRIQDYARQCCLSARGELEQALRELVEAKDAWDTADREMWPMDEFPRAEKKRLEAAWEKARSLVDPQSPPA